MANELCQLLPPDQFEGISIRQSRALSRKSNHALSQEQQWFAIWDIVYPGMKRPSSAYIDSDLAEELCAFRDYYQDQGTSVIMASLDSNATWEMSSEERNSNVRRIIREALNQIYERWVSTRRDGLANPCLRSQPSSTPGTYEFQTPELQLPKVPATPELSQGQSLHHPASSPSVAEFREGGLGSLDMGGSPDAVRIPKPQPSEHLAHLVLQAPDAVQPTVMVPNQFGPSQPIPPHSYLPALENQNDWDLEVFFNNYPGEATLT
ncbi:unnamed protein product [Parascedosporium putredinis]|uniref:Uncharacterized protein n=1 Tax=Parascedosporium putredinis TaxID=1442378 RepID=A0A9P1H5V8_9PEZI|nr:unnamed protein product [Parascedosporium putredinis]CAI7996806.1 unnamed protein product [Parascedosporium putredinis]